LAGLLTVAKLTPSAPFERFADGRPRACPLDRFGRFVTVTMPGSSFASFDRSRVGIHASSGGDRRWAVC
jgi:hypothetical protein